MILCQLWLLLFSVCYRSDNVWRWRAPGFTSTQNACCEMRGHQTNLCESATGVVRPSVTKPAELALRGWSGAEGVAHPAPLSPTHNGTSAPLSVSPPAPARYTGPCASGLPPTMPSQTTHAP